MPERLTTEEIAEFWDGHHFTDNCGWKDSPFRPVDYLRTPFVFPRIMGEFYRNMLARDKELLNELRAFLAGRPVAPLKRITEGQKFDPSEYHPGTVLSISKKRLLETYNSVSVDMWGILSHEWQPDKKAKNVVVGFDKMNTLLGIMPVYGGYRNWHETFTVGEVIHDKQKEFPLIKHQTLTRYGTVEIWKFGLADPKRNPLLAPSLRPSTQKR